MGTGRTNRERGGRKSKLPSAWGGGAAIMQRWHAAACALAIALTPACAHAKDPFSIPLKAPLNNGYPAGDPIQSWLAMVSASQAAQPSWMTPLVTVTPRLEQEFRFDSYDQQNAAATSPNGNGQHLVNYGGPGGARLEFIPAYDWEVILAPPPYISAIGPKGNGEGWGDWPAFLVKYRIISANAQNGD